MMEIINCEQGSDDWFRARLGIPTASEFHSVMSKGRGKEPSKTRRTYMLKLLGEIIMDEPMDRFSTAHTERGHALEPEARDFYAFKYNCEPQQVGFIRNGKKGCSPDSLIGSDGMLEIKTKVPYLALDYLTADSLPTEHKAQCQGALWVAEREWIDLEVYWPGLPTFITRTYRDEPFIKELSDSIDAFNEELATAVQRIRAYGEPQKEAA